MCHLRSYHLAVEFYQGAKATKLPHYIKDQLRRAALSVVLNLSEGTGKSSMPDRKRFFEIAFGSIRECQSIAHLEPDSFSAAQTAILDHLAAATYKLIKNSKPRGSRSQPSKL